MTDVIKGLEDVDSASVVPRLRREPDLEATNANIFREKLRTLGSTNTTLITLGGAAYRILIRNFKDEFRIIKIPHYSIYCGEEKCKAALMAALNGTK